MRTLPRLVKSANIIREPVDLVVLLDVGWGGRVKSADSRPDVVLVPSNMHVKAIYADFLHEEGKWRAEFK